MSDNVFLDEEETQDSRDSEENTINRTCKQGGSSKGNGNDEDTYA